MYYNLFYKLHGKHVSNHTEHTNNNDDTNILLYLI